VTLFPHVISVVSWAECATHSSSLPQSLPKLVVKCTLSSRSGTSAHPVTCIIPSCLTNILTSSAPVSSPRCSPCQRLSPWMDPHWPGTASLQGEQARVQARQCPDGRSARTQLARLHCLAATSSVSTFKSFPQCLVVTPLHASTRVWQGAIGRISRLTGKAHVVTPVTLVGRQVAGSVQLAAGSVFPASGPGQQADNAPPAVSISQEHDLKGPRQLSRLYHRNSHPAGHITNLLTTPSYDMQAHSVLQPCSCYVIC